MNERPWQPGAKKREIALALPLAVSLFLLPSLLRSVLSGSYAVAASGAIALIAVALALPSDVYGMRKLSLPDVAWSIAAAILIQFCVGIATLLWSVLLKKIHVDCAEIQPAAQWIARSGVSAELLFLIFAFCLAAPIVEEVLFRRLVYNWLLPFGRNSAILLTAVLFAASHFFLYGFAGLLVMGLGFQLLFLKRKNLSAAMLAHSWINLCAMIDALLKS